MFQFKCVSDQLNKAKQWRDKQQNFAYLKRITKRQFAFCNAVAIHPNSFIFINGFDESIKAFCIVSINGAMKEIYKFKNHFQEVTCLKFLRNTEQFISGSYDKSIKIWTKYSSWIVDQTLSEHNGYISSFVLNNEENLLVSSSDKNIKFWAKNLIWQCTQTISCHKGLVYSISLNNSGDKLITCGSDGYIFLLQKQQDESWIVSQHNKQIKMLQTFLNMINIYKSLKNQRKQKFRDYHLIPIFSLYNTQIQSNFQLQSKARAQI